MQLTSLIYKVSDSAKLAWPVLHVALLYALSVLRLKEETGKRVLLPTWEIDKPSISINTVIFC